MVINFLWKWFKNDKGIKKMIKEIVLKEHNKLIKIGGMMVKSFPKHPDNQEITF